MARYAVFACDVIYGGLHGMNTTCVTEADSDAEVAEFAKEESMIVIDSFSDIYEALEREVEEEIEFAEEEMSEEDIDDLRDEIYFGDIDYAFAKVDESKVDGMTTDELDKLCYDLSYEDFVKRYCYNS